MPSNESSARLTSPWTSAARSSNAGRPARPPTGGPGSASNCGDRSGWTDRAGEPRPPRSCTTYPSRPGTRESHGTTPGAARRGEPTWTPAHADLTWANLTGPELRILDWEDWGTAPRGRDAARLWFASLAYPALAGKIRKHLDADLSSRDGRIMALFECAGWLASASDSEPRTAPARAEAERLISELSA